MKKLVLLVSAAMCFTMAQAQFRFNAQHPDVHDPVMAKGEDGRFYIFTTGFNVGSYPVQILRSGNQNPQH